MENELQRRLDIQLFQDDQQGIAIPLSVALMNALDSRYVKEKRKSCCGLPCTDRGRESKTVPYDKFTDCDVQETWFELVLAGFTILHPWICLEDGCVHAIRLSDPTGRAQNKQGFPSCTFDLDQG